MSPRPAIFISAVSSELRSARQLVANVLTFLGYDPEWQDIFGTQEGDLRAMLRRRIDSCNGVVQLVGQCYGAEPPNMDERFGRVSYTQYEALYAVGKGKKVWYLLLDESFPGDPHELEDEQKQSLQSAYRSRVKSESHIYYALNSKESLELSVFKLRDDLSKIRRAVRRWTALVAGLLIATVTISLWVLHNQQHSNEQLQALQQKFDKLQQGVNSFVEVQSAVRREQPGQKPDQLEQRTYDELGKQLGLDPVALRQELPRFAQELKKAANSTPYERASAAYIEKDYNEAERLALVAADDARSANPPMNSDIIKALELAAEAAEKRIEYADALTRLREAEKLTDRTRDPIEWARIQFGIAQVLEQQGKYADAEGMLRQVLVERQRILGNEHMDTLGCANELANALYFQGKYSEAEAAYRAVTTLKEKVLGPEHISTLKSRNNLASALDSEGKYDEAETELHAVIKLKEKALGAEHPDTLATRNNLAAVLDQQGKYAEAESEDRTIIEIKERVLGPAHPDTITTRSNLADVLEHEGKYSEAEYLARENLKLREKVLGPEHPSTLNTRYGLAAVLADQRKYSEAETEYRAVLKLQEKVLTVDHPNTLRTCYSLAVCLRAESQLSEANQLAQRAADGALRVLGQNHPDTKRYEQLRQELQAASVANDK
ncbi:MAG: tetratricopeptide repeat protein [Verrucomicrobia bacterium]|nr:tetratricopeptide repeat protein [Verrucomicrobiota bacterium]